MSDVNGPEDMTEGFWTCNIETKGRVIRLVAGLLALGGASWCWWEVNSGFWASGLLAIGLVSVFEGLRGWCVVRAFGAKTPW